MTLYTVRVGRSGVTPHQNQARNLLLPTPHWPTLLCSRKNQVGDFHRTVNGSCCQASAKLSYANSRSQLQRHFQLPRKKYSFGMFWLSCTSGHQH